MGRGNDLQNFRQRGRAEADGVSRNRGDLERPEARPNHPEKNPEKSRKTLKKHKVAARQVSSQKSLSLTVIVDAVPGYRRHCRCLSSAQSPTVSLAVADSVARSRRHSPWLSLTASR